MDINAIKLNEEQLKAVRDTEGAVLVIAGAGSGKTRVLTARICHLIESGVDPYNILAITFTNKAANEMKFRIEAACAAGAGVWTSTFHSMCARILRIDSDKLGYGPNFSIYTDLESDRVVKRVATEVPGADPKRKGDYLWHISRAKTLGMSPAEYHETIREQLSDANVVTNVYKTYENELKKSDALDFDDLLLKTVELFDKNPDVLAKYQRRFKYINVDEFQDTNGLQYRLVRMLSALNGNVFAVGDEDQSIYSWRGAEIRNILDFKKDFPDAKTYKLEQNYRSTTSILQAANNVIKNNRARNKKTLWSERAAEDSVEYYEAYSDRDEADYVIREIDRLVNSGSSLKDIAVLVRANSLTRVFEENFNNHGIPYKIFGGFRFFERKEIKDALAYVRLALNPSDNDSLLRIINYPKRGIGSTAVAELVQTANEFNMTYFSVLINPGMLSAGTAKKLSPFYSIAVDIHNALEDAKPSKFMQFVIERSGLEAALSSSTDPDDRNRLENLSELVNAVTQFEADNPEATISEFMQSVSLVSDSDEMTDDNYVTVATIHAVKGLEYENVFVVGLEEGIFPTSRALSSGDIEEERRLMYVAVTRAKDKLFVTNARSRYRFGETVRYCKSRFVSEMRGEKRSLRVGGDVKNSRSADFESPLKNAAARRLSDIINSETARSGRPQAGGRINFDEFEKNIVVEHTKFGRGIIISTSGEGEDKTAAIAFKGLGVKHFSLAVASACLKVVKE